MRNLLLGLLLVAGNAIFGQNYDTVYINPDYNGTEDGTLNHPFNTWEDVNLQSNTVYLQKRGTTAQGGISIIDKDYLKIGPYGNGAKPILTNVPGLEANIIGISKSNYCEISDFNLIGSYPISPTSGVQITGNWSTGISSNITVKNCEISFCYNGIRILPGQTYVETVTVIGCEIHHIEEDGIFAEDVANFSCINTHIYKVNLDWHYDCHSTSCASGDGIQLTGNCDNFLLDNCIIDRRYTGLKFCFIHNSDNATYHNDGIIRDCIFYPPKDTVGATSAGGALFLSDGDTLIIERTKIIGGERLYSNDAGTGGQISFDYIFMNYVLGDSVHNLQVSMKNEFCYVNNTTFTSNSPDHTILDLSGGETIVKNSVIAAGPNTTPYYDINQMDSCRFYQGPSANWQSIFGWVDWAHGNYHLLENSTLKDQGISTSFSLDLDKNPVPQGSATDIGTYEYQEGSSLVAPEPAFIASDTSISAGESVTFYDLSTNNPTTWLWIIPGGQPFISTDQNPTVTFPEEGDFDITLCVSNDAGINHIEKNGFIQVIDDMHIFYLKAFLEGPFKFWNLMISYLNIFGIMPLNQPFNEFPWYYNGTESISDIPNIDVVDWVLVEFRVTTGGPETATSDSVIKRQAGLILRNGSIVAFDGVSPIQFEMKFDGNLYVVISHRNHLQAMSSTPLTKINGVYGYDFTDDRNKIYGGSRVVKELYPGSWVIRAGDTNQDGQIDNEDKNSIWVNENGTSGYLYGDFNMDGQVNFYDLDNFWKANAGCSFKLP